MINAMLTGAIAMAALIVSLFFLRFWKSTKDRFFLYFAIAFSLESVSRIIIRLAALLDERPLIYLIRMVAYLLILFAIFEKNRQYHQQNERENKLNKVL